MCNICALFSPTPITEEMRNLIFDTQTLAGTKHSDGFGYFTKKGYFKSPYEASSTTFTRKHPHTLGTDFLVTHVRKVSSGKVTTPKAEDEEGWDKYFKLRTAYAHHLFSKI